MGSDAGKKQQTNAENVRGFTGQKGGSISVTKQITFSSESLLSVSEQEGRAARERGSEIKSSDIINRENAPTEPCLRPSINMRNQHEPDESLPSGVAVDWPKRGNQSIHSQNILKSTMNDPVSNTSININISIYINLPINLNVSINIITRAGEDLRSFSMSVCSLRGRGETDVDGYIYYSRRMVVLPSSHCVGN